MSKDKQLTCAKCDKRYMSANEWQVICDTCAGQEVAAFLADEKNAALNKRHLREIEKDVHAARLRQAEQAATIEIGRKCYNFAAVLVALRRGDSKYMDHWLTDWVDDAQAYLNHCASSVFDHNQTATEMATAQASGDIYDLLVRKLYVEGRHPLPGITAATEMDFHHSADDDNTLPLK